MKVALSYSLFGDPSSFEFPFYFRGAYFNARMNEVLFPGFDTVIHVADDIYQKYFSFWHELQSINQKIFIVDAGPHKQRCESMLWRFLPIFRRQYDFVLCRDLDSVSTYREACCIYEWLDSTFPYHAINDNAAHSGLMGGMVGFKPEAFMMATKINSFEELIGQADLRSHGSDQNLMNRIILPIINNALLFHFLYGSGMSGKPPAKVVTRIQDTPKVHPSLWVTDLISRYIGSAGVIDFELLRFLRSRVDQWKYDQFEKDHADLLYWVC